MTHAVSTLRTAVRWGLRLGGGGLLLGVVLVLFWLRAGLYNRIVRFPAEAAAWEGLRAQRQPVADDAGWHEYRGILHSHSHLSHDSDVSFEEILQVLRSADLDFIALSDHCVEGRADFTGQWRGLHDGRLFIPGFEMKEGLMPFGVASGVVLSNGMDSASLAREVVKQGGVLFYAHPEEPRDWDRPELDGMEIYNLHTDFKRLPGGLGALLPDLLLSLRRYPDHIVYSMFRRPVEFLQRWDELNRTRRLVGIAGNDCHQNVGFRAIYTSADTVRVEDTSPEVLREFRLNGWTRPMVRLLLGPLEPNRTLFHIQFDPYERSARFVNTHVLARSLSEAAVLEALRVGRVFVGFDVIADSSSFRWWAQDREHGVVMGESLPWSPDTRLQARSPLPARFTILKDGARVCRAEGRGVEYVPDGSGSYRVEAELKVLEEWVPWVYANPIRLE